MVGTSHASLEVHKFPGNFLRRQFTRIRDPTGGLGVELDCALLPPRFEVLDFVGGLRILHPLNNLGHRHEVNVIVVGQDFIDPVEEGVKEFRVVLQPSGVEVKSERCAVRVVVTLKVVVQESVKLIT